MHWALVTYSKVRAACLSVTPGRDRWMRGLMKKEIKRKGIADEVIGREDPNRACPLSMLPLSLLQILRNDECS